MKLNKNILFTIIPKGYWITLVIAVSFTFLGGEFLKLANIGFNIIIFLVGLKLAILIHEVGHLLFAWFIGGTPRRMILGNGHKVVETKFKDIKIILNSKFNSGLAYVAFDNLNLIRLKLLCYTSGGFLTNSLVASILLLVFDFSTDASSGIQLSSAIVFANLFIGVSALIPYYSNYQGLRLYSDGLSILRIPFLKKSQLIELSSVNELLDAYELFETKKYKEAIAIYENFQSKTQKSKIANVNLSIAYMKLGNYEHAVKLMEELLPLMEEEPFKPFKAIIYNGIAWEYLLLNKLNEADKYSDMAYKIDSNAEHIRGTRASVLIEKGKYEEGKNLLINDIDFNFPNNITLAASIYVGLAFHELNQPKKAEKYINFVENNMELLDIDEQTLYERSKRKVEVITNTKTYSTSTKT